MENLTPEQQAAYDRIFKPIPAWMFGSSVEARNALQQSGRVHPYTCGNDECRHKTNQAPLLAVEGGWLCEHCGYTQKLSRELETGDTLARFQKDRP